MKDFTFSLLTFLLKNIRKLLPHQSIKSIYSSTMTQHLLGGSLFEKYSGVLSARWLWKVTVAPTLCQIKGLEWNSRKRMKCKSTKCKVTLFGTSSSGSEIRKLFFYCTLGACSLMTIKEEKRWMHLNKHGITEPCMRCDNERGKKCDPQMDEVKQILLWIALYHPSHSGSRKTNWGWNRCREGSRNIWGRGEPVSWKGDRKSFIALIYSMWCCEGIWWHSQNRSE